MSVADLSVDQFMNEEFSTGSSGDDDVKTKPVAKKKLKTKKKKATGNVKKSHQKQLDSLKEKDPEFYQFLQEEEANLLKFDENLDEDSTDEEDDLHQPPAELMEASDSEEDEALEEMNIDEEIRSGVMKQVALKQSMIDRWESEMDTDQMSVHTLHEVMQAYHAAVYQFGGKNQQDQKDKKAKKENKYLVTTGQMFNEIAGLCIRKLIPCLSKYLKYNTKGKADSNKSKMQLPSSTKAWGSVKQSVKMYLEDVCKLVEVLLDIVVQGTMLRHTLLLTPFFLCFPKITKSLYKVAIKLWSTSSDESVRVLAFLILNRIVTLEKKQHLKKVLKQTYLAYVANCKFTSPSTLPMINFMQRTLCELFAIDTALTYELAFLYIRQLAIHLRQAMTQHKKESYQAVYNWQYVHCIELWSHMLATLHNNTLHPLIFPLVQVALGTIDLIPTPRYFPLRFHIVRCLTTLGDKTNTYIPLLSYILRPLQLAEFTKVRNNTSHKKIIFATILKLSNSELKEKSYQETTIDEVYELLMRYINTQAHTIAFPEMMVPAVLTIKKYIKSCKGQGYAKIMKQILEKVSENSTFVTEARSKVSFSAADFKAVDAWENDLKTSGVPFHRQYANYHKKRERELQQEIVDKDAVVAERLPTIDREKFMETSKSKDRDEFQGLFAEMDEDETETMETDFASAVNENKHRRKKRVFKEEEEMSEDEFSDLETEDVAVPMKQKVVLPSQASRPIPNEDGEVPESGDIVDDFVFSDEDD